MAISPEPISLAMPMGATLVPGGVTFRTWAPHARDVHVALGAPDFASWRPDAASRLIALGDGTWAGFAPGIGDGEPYLFWIRGPQNGPQSEGLKRDPFARELRSPRCTPAASASTPRSATACAKHCAPS
jgi:1,4-alpha-glucan branching enzyme